MPKFTRFTRFSEKSFFKEKKIRNMGKVWLVDAIALNCSMELDSTNYSMGFREICFLRWCNFKNSNSWFLIILNGFSESLSLFMLIFQVIIFDISCVKNVNLKELGPATYLRQGRFDMWVILNSKIYITFM